jgi:hypothetical protein
MAGIYLQGVHVAARQLPGITALPSLKWKAVFFSMQDIEAAI